MKGNNNMQHARQHRFRHGFPISSQEINDLFDGYLYDLLTILKTDPAQYDEEFRKMIDAFQDLSAFLDNGEEKKTYKVQDEHTPNWRHI